MCGDRAGQDFWQEVAGSGSEGAPARALGHPDLVKSPCWRKQRNLSVFPRAQGHGWAQLGEGGSRGWGWL